MMPLWPIVFVIVFMTLLFNGHPMIAFGMLILGFLAFLLSRVNAAFNVGLDPKRAAEIDRILEELRTMGQRAEWALKEDNARAAAFRARVEPNFWGTTQQRRRDARPNDFEDMFRSRTQPRPPPPLQPSPREKALRVLGLPVTATAAVIRTRYLQLVKRYHPDTHPGDRIAEEKLKLINQAHQVLKGA